MKVLYLSKEFPPHTYGGAGVHLDHLCRELLRMDRSRVEIRVLCFGDQNEQREGFSVTGIEPSREPALQQADRKTVLDTLYRNVVMAAFDERADIIHCHTWYSAFAGCLLQRFLHRPLILTTHSLEPHRPWKAEQLGEGYQVSRWLEQLAYENADGVIAVSRYMKRELESIYGVPSHRIEVIPNGIDLEQYKPVFDEGILRAYGIDPDVPFVLFVGRITRQKGIVHLLDAIPRMPADLQVVLCASSPDTASLATEVENRANKVRSASPATVVWISQSVPVHHLVVLYTHARLFLCPSVYEPFGIINLESMACETPVVASAVGGIPEVVVDGVTGVLVPVSTDPNGEVRDPERFANSLARAVTELLSSPDRLKSMGAESRRRAEQYFSWQRIAERTFLYYQDRLSHFART